MTTQCITQFDAVRPQAKVFDRTLAENLVAAIAIVLLLPGASLVMSLLAGA